MVHCTVELASAVIGGKDSTKAVVSYIVTGTSANGSSLICRASRKPLLQQCE